MYPNFIIAGAEKSGTTSLAFSLSRHPDIYMPQVKELHFFDDKQNYSKGYEWYERQFDGHTKEKAVGECTPFYMYDRDCAAKISALLPDIKLIFILRNPVARAYSNYWHQVRGGKEFHSFEVALQLEDARINKSRFHHFAYSYKNKGLYALQIERFMDKFAREKILIVKFEDFKKTTSQTLNKIFNFLEVDTVGNQYYTGEIKNKSIVPRSPFLQFAARKIFGTSIPFRAIAKLNLKLGYTNYPPMHPTTWKSLADFFSSDIGRLKNMIGMDFSDWEEK